MSERTCPHRAGDFTVVAVELDRVRIHCDACGRTVRLYRCAGMTRDGDRCKLPARAGSRDRCLLHASQLDGCGTCGLQRSVFPSRRALAEHRRICK